MVTVILEERSFFSVDTGKTWDQYGTAPTSALLDIDFDSNGRVFVATPSGAYYSDNLSTWENSTGFGGTVRTVHYLGNDSLIYGTDDGIFISSDNGVSGQELEEIYGMKVYLYDNIIYTSTSGSGLYYTNKIGSSWNNLRLDKLVLALLKVNGNLFAGTSKGVYLHSDTQLNIFNHVSSPDIHVFPNPVTDILFVNNLNINNYRIEIINTLGKMVFTGDHNNEINLSKLISGIYYYRIHTDENTYVGQIIKE